MLFRGGSNLDRRSVVKPTGVAHFSTGVDITTKGVAHAEVQAQIERHFQHINQFYDCSYEMYRNLGNMYSEDTRFAENYNTVAPHLAEFMRDAIAYYCSAHEK